MRQSHKYIRYRPSLRDLENIDVVPCPVGVQYDTIEIIKSSRNKNYYSYGYAPEYKRKKKRLAYDFSYFMKSKCHSYGCQNKNKKSSPLGPNRGAASHKKKTTKKNYKKKFSTRSQNRNCHRYLSFLHETKTHKLLVPHEKKNTVNTTSRTDR